jgi:acetyl-CoA acyltransferase 1
MSTVGPSSQVAYEATAVLLLRCSTATQVGLTKNVIGDTNTVGGKPEEMDFGPVSPIP